MNIPTAGIFLCVFAALSSLGCDVGRSVLAPLDDASTDMTVPPRDGPTDGATDGSLLDVRAGTRTCSDFVACASTCAAGSGFAACVSNCARELRPASQPLFDSFATCIRASCDGGIDDGQCAGSMATLTACGAQLRACSADGAPADGGTDVPVTDAPPSDGPLTTCSAAFSVGFPRCSGTASFWPCITGLRSGLTGAELTRFNALTTCVESACGPTPTEMCATTHCYAEVTACHPICALAASCSLATCTTADCRAAVTSCSAPLSGAEATRFASLRACVERVCGAALPSACINSASTDAVCASELSACGVVLPPTDGGVDAGHDAAVMDIPAVDVPAVDVPAVDVPVVDRPTADVPLTTCSAAFEMGFPRCSGTASFWPCITGLRSGLTGAELTRFNALTTCVESACGPTPTEMCATTHCYAEVTACHPICALAASCSLATCTTPDCRGTFTSCSTPLSSTEATHFMALRTCFERVCGPALNVMCTNSPGTEAMCAAELSACGYMPVSTDAGVDAGADI